MGTDVANEYSFQWEVQQVRKILRKRISLSNFFKRDRFSRERQKSKTLEIVISLPFLLCCMPEARLSVKGSRQETFIRKGSQKLFGKVWSAVWFYFRHILCYFLSIRINGLHHIRADPTNLHWFSRFSDRTIREYCEEIWHVKPCEPTKTGLPPIGEVHHAQWCQSGPYVVILLVLFFLLLF